MKKIKYGIIKNFKWKKVCPTLDLNDARFAKKLIKSGISKKRAWELDWHFKEIERFCYGFMEDVNRIIKSKDKKKVNEILEDELNELDFHIIKNHLIPATKLLNKIYQ